VAELFYESAYGDVRLFLTKISTDRSRDLVVHPLSTGNEYVVQDRGTTAGQRARCTVLFARMPGDELSPLERCRRLQAVVDDKPRIFRHPSSGSYLARIGPFTEDIDEHGIITAELEVVRIAPIAAVSDAGAGTIPATGEGAVDAAADELAAELADVDIDSLLPLEAKAAVTDWTSTDKVDTRKVLTQVGSLTAKAGAQADALEGDIGLWQAFKSTVLLAQSIRDAAEAATSGSLSTFLLRIASPVALRAVLASVYGADEADARYDEVLALNDLVSPAWIDPGTDLVMPQLTSLARSA
jgi:hypothetical protein